MATSRRGVGDEIRADPFDRIANVGRDLCRRESDFVHRDLDALGRSRGRRGKGREHKQERRGAKSRPHRTALLQGMDNLFGVLLVTAKDF